MDPQDYGGTMRVVPPTVAPDAVVFVGGHSYENGWIKLVFERNRRRFVIVWANPNKNKTVRSDDITEETIAEGERQAVHQTLLGTYNFNGPTLAYLDGNYRKGYKIIQKYSRLPRISCPTWGPLVSMGEVELNRFFGEDRHRRGGKYRGQQVDLWIAFDRRTIEWLDNMMRNYLMLAELDLTYKAVGHLVDDDGAVIGLITEPANGRQAEYRDKSLVYDAVARLHQRNIVATSVSPFTTHIQRGKVRFSDLLAIKYYPSQKDLDFYAQRGQFADLKLFFSSPPPPEWAPTKARVGLPYVQHNAAWLLPLLPSPEIILSAFLHGDNHNVAYRQRSRRSTRSVTLGPSQQSEESDCDSVSLVKRRNHRNHAKMSASPYNVRPYTKLLSPDLRWETDSDLELRVLDSSDSATVCSVD